MVEHQPGDDRNKLEVGGSSPAPVDFLRINMTRELISASPEHEKNFRDTWGLRGDVVNDPLWIMAYEHAAKYKLYPDEINAIGPVLIRKDAPLS